MKKFCKLIIKIKLKIRNKKYKNKIIIIYKNQNKKLEDKGIYKHLKA